MQEQGEKVNCSHILLSEAGRETQGKRLPVALARKSKLNGTPKGKPECNRSCVVWVDVSEPELFLCGLYKRAKGRSYNAQAARSSRGLMWGGEYVM